MRLTTARLMSGSMSANAAMAVFGSVSVTALDGASNFRGRPRRGSRAAIGVGIFENISFTFLVISINILGVRAVDNFART
jgi:hypothetical protein